jgi:hypothetical protein
MSSSAGKSRVLAPLDPLSYVCPDRMISRALLDWSDGFRNAYDRQDLSDWVATSVVHMKNFHFSAVFHEFLRFTIKERGTNPEEPMYLIAERLKEGEEVTVGWKWTQPPKSSAWWIKRLLRGQYGDATQAILASSSTVEHWRAVGYSASDSLCYLNFEEPGVPLTELSKIFNESAQAAPKYSAVTTNCFWFSFTVWEALKKGPWLYKEQKPGYYHHRGKFARLSILSSVMVSLSLSQTI